MVKFLYKYHCFTSLTVLLLSKEKKISGFVKEAETMGLTVQGPP